MNNSAAAATSTISNLTPDQQVRLQADLADREKQASSLAAAGMVAESVGYSRGQVLQAPPALVGMPLPQAGPATAVPLSSLSTDAGGAAATSNGGGGVPHVESINWNLDVDSAGPMLGSGLDDIDMDFASLFDTEEQQQFLAEGTQPSAT